ncbi:hypothetical protein CDAR_525971 [Caerostris darwini]|uniref:Uncharacterized protein n=1 Tax=Caerostris darwini TaxID=1538125 RepID=A0AAV4S5Y9_9ARAC|nr:hypothetical protein CDAR_525971 [Caerostris darwini]
MNNGSAIEKDEEVLSFGPTKGMEKKKGTAKVRVAADLLLPIGMELHKLLNGLRVIGVNRICALHHGDYAACSGKHSKSTRTNGWCWRGIRNCDCDVAFAIQVQHWDCYYALQLICTVYCHVTEKQSIR